MLRILENMPAGIVAVQAVGTVSKDDYDHVLTPALDAATRKGRVRLLYQLGPELEGFTPAAAWEDAKQGLRFVHSLDGCAVVTDVAFIRDSLELFRFVVPCPLRLFRAAELEQAVTWLRELPTASAISFRLLDDVGVVVVEVSSPLRASDFDLLASVVDPWMDAHDGLQGVVVHAHRFPGWENLTGMMRHLQFVRAHQGRVRRAALAVDGTAPGMLAKLADRFVHPELRVFGYDALEQAVAWAGNTGRDASANEMRSEGASA